MVGTRNPSILGVKWAQFISDWFSNNGFTIVSGMASGIDSVTHRAAQKNKGGTIGVLAHGLDHIYPQSNHDLFKTALKTPLDETNRILLLTEYALGVKPRRYFFARRNRLISGLCQSI